MGERSCHVMEAGLGGHGCDLVLLLVVRMVWCCQGVLQLCGKVCGEECDWRGRATAHTALPMVTELLLLFLLVCVFCEDTRTENNWTTGSAVCGEISTFGGWCVGVGCDGSTSM